MSVDPNTLHIRWLGRVPYHEALDLQRALFTGSANHVLLLEHPPVYTMGVRAKAEHLLIDPDDSDADVVMANRGGDITFHGHGQLVGYPIVSVPSKRGGGMADTAAYVASVEQILIDALGDLGLADHVPLGTKAGYPGVWLEPEQPTARKIAAIGVRMSRGRTMHGFALNVNVDLDYFDHIVPCGIREFGVTSLWAEGFEIPMAEVVDRVAHHAGITLLPGHRVERHDSAMPVPLRDLAPFTRGEGPGEPIRPGRGPSRGRSGESIDPAPLNRDADALRRGPSADDKPSTRAVSVKLTRRLRQAGVGEGLDVSTRKPDWMRVKASTGPEFRRLRSLTRELGLVTVCEEAGCPNIFECWNDGTATFMLLGERCTRACGFCLVDTRKPLAPDAGEPARVAEAIGQLGLDFAVLTMVARDDLPDGGAAHVAATVTAINQSAPQTGIEVLISDLKGSAEALELICAAGPTVLNHNTETVPRLQRAVRPSANYARSLTVLARARAQGMITKSGLIVGMGETVEEVRATLVDLAAVGVDIVTIGQYLRPTTHHIPVQRWWTPEEFAALAAFGEQELGIGRVEASPLTRSSHHAADSAAAILAQRGAAAS